MADAVVDGEMGRGMHLHLHARRALHANGRDKYLATNHEAGCISATIKITHSQILLTIRHTEVAICVLYTTTPGCRLALYYPLSRCHYGRSYQEAAMFRHMRGGMSMGMDMDRGFGMGMGMGGGMAPVAAAAAVAAPVDASVAAAFPPV